MPTKSKDTIISERQAKLPLPEDPPTASDFNSADGRITNGGSGAISGDVSTGDGSTAGLREPSSKGSGVREAGGVDMSGIGREGVEKRSGDH